MPHLNYFDSLEVDKKAIEKWESVKHTLDPRYKCNWDKIRPIQEYLRILDLKAEVQTLQTEIDKYKSDFFAIEMELRAMKDLRKYMTEKFKVNVENMHGLDVVTLLSIYYERAENGLGTRTT